MSQANQFPQAPTIIEGTPGQGKTAFAELPRISEQDVVSIQPASEVASTPVDQEVATSTIDMSNVEIKDEVHRLGATVTKAVNEALKGSDTSFNHIVATMNPSAPKRPKL